MNTGIDDITCIRIIDIIVKARDGEVDVPRKVAKAIKNVGMSPARREGG